MSTHTGHGMTLAARSLAGACLILGLLLITGCAPKPEVVIVNETTATIKADVQFPVTQTINGFPMPGKRTQTIIAPNVSDRAFNGVEVASRKIWLRVVCLTISDASLVSPTVDPFEFSVDGRGSKVILTVTAEGRTLRVMAVDDSGTTLNLLPFPKESPRPADMRQPVFDSIGFPGEDVR